MKTRLQIAAQSSAVLALAGSVLISVPRAAFAQAQPVVPRASAPRVSPLVDVDGDGEMELIVTLPERFATESYGLYLDEDLDLDEILVGTRGGARIVATRDADADARDTEIIVEDPNLDVDASLGRDLDGDGDFDILVVGPGGGVTGETANSFGGGVTPPSSQVENSGRGFSGPARYNTEPVRYNTTPVTYANTMAVYRPGRPAYRSTMAVYDTRPAPAGTTSLLRGGLGRIQPVVQGAPPAIRGTLRAVVKPGPSGPTVRPGRF